jgi:hypothetical protein
MFQVFVQPKETDAFTRNIMCEEIHKGWMLLSCLCYMQKFYITSHLSHKTLSVQSRLGRQECTRLELGRDSFRISVGMPSILTVGVLFGISR